MLFFVFVARAADAIATVNFLVQRFNGDPGKVLITGHSRGSLSTMFIGLHNDRIAKLWTAFAPIAHFDGAHVTKYGKKPWQIFPPYPNGTAKDAAVRLKRVGTRPVFVAGECQDATGQAMTFLNSTGIDLANFTVLGLGFIDHDSKCLLRPDPMGTRTKLRVWVAKVLDVTMPIVPRSPVKSDDHAAVDSCTSDLNCSLFGVCTRSRPTTTTAAGRAGFAGGVCVCDPGFEGPRCGSMRLKPVAFPQGYVHNQSASVFLKRCW